MKQEELKEMMKNDIYMKISEGNVPAMETLKEIEKYPKTYSDILTCESLDIRGLNLNKLYNKCCNKNINKFRRTLNMFRYKTYSEEEILNNLNMEEPIPFIDDNIKIEGVPSYEEEFGKEHEAWKRFCITNKKEYNKKMETLLQEKEENKIKI